MGLLGGTAATNELVASSVNTQTPIGGDGTSGNPVSFAPYTNPVFYVDPVTGNDSNDGSIGAPFLTIDRANSVLNPGWKGFATINLRGGTSTIEARTVWPSPIGASDASAGGLLINGMDSTDSGLGARTAAGGTAGALAVFGTLIDSVGGFVVNAFRGQFIRFTSGATLNGRSFLIVSNDATTFTIAGVFPVAPTVETFVVETPAGVLSWAGTEVMQAEGAVGFQNVAFAGPGGANALRFSRGNFGFQRCAFATTGTGGIQVRNGAVLQDLNAITTLFGSLTITQQCGCFFNGTPISPNISSTAGGMYAGGINFNRSLLLNSNVEALTSIAVQFLSTFFTGNSYLRVAYGCQLLLGQCRFDAVTPAPAFGSAILGALGAALVISKRAGAALFNVDISNTPATTAPGDAVLCEDSSIVTFSAVVGVGNAGLGLRVARLSEVRIVGANTVTGAAGDVQIGANPVVLWAALAAINTDLVQLCIGGP